jgi:hypothetical protein
VAVAPGTPLLRGPYGPRRLWTPRRACRRCPACWPSPTIDAIEGWLEVTPSEDGAPKWAMRMTNGINEEEMQCATAA